MSYDACVKGARSPLEEFLHDDGFRGVHQIIFSPISIGVGDYRAPEV